MVARTNAFEGWGGVEVGGGGAGALSLCGELRTMEGGWGGGVLG